MTLPGKYDRHAALVDRMAGAAGVDLDEAQQRGDLSAQELQAGVHTCLGCTDVTACEHWLQASGEAVDATPAYCRNAGLFKALKS